ncbi:MAG TPA: DUF2380 domain-containing protein, partial [Gammaproteobacteria bacterium]|nr:DUF2380 domain-containing protein [Gammaproteobacteria bacterium]
MTRWMLALLVLGLGLPGPAPAKEKAHSATTVLVMPFELVDTSLQGELEGSKRDLGWVHHLTGYVEGLLRDSGRYRILDRKPVAGLINTFQDDYRYVYRCRTCAVKAAREAGADLVVVGWVQKVSNLIRNLT